VFKRFGAAAVLALGLQALTSASALAAPAIIPAPLSVTPAPGRYALQSGAAIVYAKNDPQSPLVAQRLQALFADAVGVRLEIREGAPRPGDIALAKAEAGDLGTEGYTLRVSPDGVTIAASAPEGLLYGGVTLWQLATQTPGARGPVPIDAVLIRDKPRFAWRGLLLDSARHYQSPAYIRRFIDWMALHKLNVLHWHLTDDQAWRLEIKKYPKLTQVGAWRVPAGEAPAKDIDPQTGEPRLYGGFYTQDEVRALVAYASERGITIVPEIDVPGHASAAVVAYPELAATDSPPKAVPSDWGVYPNLFNVEERTLAFLEDVLAEVVSLFPGHYVHLGGDEAIKDQWKASARVQARMRELGVTDEEKLQGWYMARLERFLNARDRALIGWDEILEGGVAPSATVMSWRGTEGAIEAARNGHDTVLTPAPDLYFDHRQSAHDGAPGRVKVISLESVYRFEPMPAVLTPDQRRHVLGVQANLWTEHMRSEERVTYQAYPRVAALAEVGWSERRDWDDFKARLKPQLARYQRLGIGYAEHALDGLYGPAPRPAADQRFDHELKLCSEDIALSLIDDAPLRGERATFTMDIMGPCWRWDDADLTGVKALEVDVGQVPFNFQIGKDIEKVRFAKARTAEGELEVRAGSCEAAPFASIPLALAARDPGVTTLTVPMPAALSGRQALCFSFAQPRLEPLWGLDRVKLVRGGS
jgi:hexosaminidase